MELVGTYEIAQMLGGVSRERVRQLYNKPGFPQPVAILHCGRIWNRNEIAAWIRSTGRDLNDEGG